MGFGGLIRGAIGAKGNLIGKIGGWTLGGSEFWGFSVKMELISRKLLFFY